VTYTFRPYEDWLEGYDGDPWIVPGIVHGVSTLWLAKQKIGKSLLMTDLAVALATGEGEWLGRPIKDDYAGRPVFIFVSDPKAQVEAASRLEAWDVPKGRVHSGRMRRGPEPTTEWLRLADEVDVLGGKVVILDSGTNLVHDIITPEHTNPLFDGLNELTERGLSVQLVHHLPRNGNSAAGIYAWESWSRWIVRMTGKGKGNRLLSFEGNDPCELPDKILVGMPRKGEPGSRFTLTNPDASRAGEDAEAPARQKRDQDASARRKAIVLSHQPWENQEAIGVAIGKAENTKPLTQPQVSRMLKTFRWTLKGGKIVDVDTGALLDTQTSFGRAA
jgi:hypothetical protein